MSLSWLPSPAPVSRESRIIKVGKSDRCHEYIKTRLDTELHGCPLGSELEFMKFAVRYTSLTHPTKLRSLQDRALSRLLASHSYHPISHKFEQIAQNLAKSPFPKIIGRIDIFVNDIFLMNFA